MEAITNDVTAVVVVMASAFLILSSLRYIISFTMRLLLPLTVLAIGICMFPGLKEKAITGPCVQMVSTMYNDLWQFLFE